MYSVATVQDALGRWAENHGLSPKNVYIFCCFFVSNQYRILYTPDAAAEHESLEEIFERNLLRIGYVALLDTFEKP